LSPLAEDVLHGDWESGKATDWLLRCPLCVDRRRLLKRPFIIDAQEGADTAIDCLDTI
jgi:hypothetical protein